MTSNARVVIVGGGIVGASVAYHLTRLGWRDVLLLEQGGLSGGTTWHAAGLVGQLRSSRNLTQLIRYSAELYERLQAETGQATGFRRCGSLAVARVPERMVQLKRNASLARSFGIEAEVISPAEAGRLYPILRTDDLVGAVWIPSDGKANPADVTQALARGARAGGATIREKVRVTGIRIARGAVAGVETAEGFIATEIVVNCAGMWARELGRRSGVNVPLHACEHMYMVTSPFPGVTPDLPVLRDADGHIYFKEEVGGLLMGGFDPWAKPWGADGIPEGFSFATLPEDWGQFELLMRNAVQRVPALETAPVRMLLNGPESFTPDNYFILGEAPEVRRCYVGAGFCSGGIAAAGGAGKALAEWIVEDRPPMDLWPADIRRFAPFHGDRRFLAARASEVVGVHYFVAFPNREFESGRGLRRSPLYDRLAARGACFGAKMGWERANWFAPAGVTPETEYSFGRLGFAVAFDKPVPFIGRDAVLAQRGRPLAKRLVSFVLEDPAALPLGDEPVWCDGRLAGSVTSAAYGHTLGRAVALGWVCRRGGVDATGLATARFEIEIAGERFAARAGLKAPYDPAGLRVRA